MSPTPTRPRSLHVRTIILLAMRNLRRQLWRTMLTAAVMVIGGALGVAIGSSALLYRGIYPLLIGFNTVPKSALVPLLVTWFGIGVVPAIITSFLISFFPILVNVATCIATVEPELQDVLRSLGARKSVII